MLKKIWAAIDGNKTLLGLAALATQIDWNAALQPMTNNPSTADAAGAALVIIGLIHKAMKLYRAIKG